MMGGFGLGGGMLFGGLLMLVFWVLIIGGAVWLVVTLARNNQGATATTASGQSSLTILQARYAKGEISKEQFDAIKRDLGV
ncbi:MAG: SHOCT domain-containing protein [Chloroflexi bacterium]|nr:SHOCT domain-containing protein [Chloroflexota bacterium]